MARAAAQFEALAQGLKADGYNAAVVARKLISEHGMDEAEATWLVSRLFGKPVNPRAGDTTSRVLVGLALVAGGLGALWFDLWTLGWTTGSILMGGVWLSMAGAGGRLVFISLVNHGMKDELRPR